MHDCFVYVASGADIDPVKTLLLFAPERDAKHVEDVEAFARRSGWVEQAERDGAVLVAPIAPGGWDACPGDLARRVYEERRRTFRSVAGKGLPGRSGSLWAWETLIYLIGYEEGATFAGDFLLAHPGFAAASILVGAAGKELSSLDRPSDHWLVPDPSDYRLRNRDIPVAVWFVGEGRESDAVFAALREVDGACMRASSVKEGVPIEVWSNPDDPACRLWRTARIPADALVLARVGMEQFFDHVIRWKNGPDGTLAARLSKCEFAAGDRYRHHEVAHAGVPYRYALYLPGGYSEVHAAMLPLVISLHGRGEPAWIFAGKNGWEALADETHAFAVMVPDSPGNIWSFDRDAEALEAMISDALRRYGLDAARVYLTGFSNGAMMTCQMATARPSLFAAASPWNSPGAAALSTGGFGGFLYDPGFERSGFDMPFWACYGDSDDKAPVIREKGFEAILAANGCAKEPSARWGEDRYTRGSGFKSGNRLETDVFAGADGRVMAGFTVVRNMPHGAIPDEARACWLFMRRFSRPLGAQHVEVFS